MKSTADQLASAALAALLRALAEGLRPERDAEIHTVNGPRRLAHVLAATKCVTCAGVVADVDGELTHVWSDGTAVTLPACTAPVADDEDSGVALWVELGPASPRQARFTSDDEILQFLGFRGVLDVLDAVVPPRDREARIAEALFAVEDICKSPGREA